MALQQRGRKSAASLATAAITTAMRYPPAPEGLSDAATSLWTSICKSLPCDYFTPGDLPLLEAYVVAHDRKRKIDAQVLKHGLLVEGVPHPGLKLGRDEATIMASLAGKLRLCQSSRTRADAATLQRANLGPKPWEDSPASEYFNDRR